MSPRIRRARMAHEITQHQGMGVALLVVAVLLIEVLSHWPLIWAAIKGVTR